MEHCCRYSGTDVPSVVLLPRTRRPPVRPQDRSPVSRQRARKFDEQETGWLALLEFGVALGYRRLAVRGLVLVDDALARRLVQLPAGGAQRDPGLVEVSPVRGLAELAHGC